MSQRHAPLHRAGLRSSVRSDTVSAVGDASVSDALSDEAIDLGFRNQAAATEAHFAKRSASNKKFQKA
jgi:hypothetical protein